jgi:hypothetical protein
MNIYPVAQPDMMSEPRATTTLRQDKENSDDDVVAVRRSISHTQATTGLQRTKSGRIVRPRIRLIAEYQTKKVEKRKSTNDKLRRARAGNKKHDASESRKKRKTQQSPPRPDLSMAQTSRSHSDIATLATTKDNKVTFVVATPSGGFENITYPIPKNYKEAINRPDKILWQKAMEEELVQMMKMKVWIAVPPENVSERSSNNDTNLGNEVPPKSDMEYYKESTTDLHYYMWI